MAICSVCGKNSSTADRNLFDGMCVNCTNRALSDENVSKLAEINNKLLKTLGGIK
jgi:NMD protein affecting ribosome stability and mRNA decay